MTSSPDNNNIPLKNFLAKPRKDQGEDCCYIAETETANTNQLSNKSNLFLPMVLRSRTPLKHPQLHKPNHHACPLGQQGDPVHGMIAQKKSSQMKK